MTKSTCIKTILYVLNTSKKINWNRDYLFLYLMDHIFEFPRLGFVGGHVKKNGAWIKGEKVVT